MLYQAIQRDYRRRRTDRIHDGHAAQRGGDYAQKLLRSIKD